MTPLVRAAVVNVAIVCGLAIELWRGAPWVAIVITATIALPIANGLMYWKQKQAARGLR